MDNDLHWRAFRRFLKWVRFVIFMVHTLAEISRFSGAGILSPRRRRCSRSGWFIAAGLLQANVCVIDSFMATSINQKARSQSG